MIVEQYILIVPLGQGTGHIGRDDGWADGLVLCSVSNKLQYPKYLHHKLLH